MDVGEISSRKGKLWKEEERPIVVSTSIDRWEALERSPSPISTKNENACRSWGGRESHSGSGTAEAVFDRISHGETRLRHPLDRAFSPKEALQGRVVDVRRDGFLSTMEISLLVESRLKSML